MRVRSAQIAAVVAALAVAGGGMAARAAGVESPAIQAPGAIAVLRNASGAALGRVLIVEDHGRISVRVKAGSLSPGFHGFHVHAAGACTAPDFTSAGGHLNPAGKSHGVHGGDLPVLLVNSDGKAQMRVRTDALTFANLFDADGSAVIVHAAPDNYANIPARYAATGPDAATLATGDAGSRVACGVVERRA